jgi:hypothetical protein
VNKVVAAASAETGDEPDWLENNKPGFVWRHQLASGLGQNMGIWQNLGADLNFPVTDLALASLRR